MGIIDDVRPYMDVRRFDDASDIVRAYTERVYDNIFPPTPQGTYAPKEHTLLYPEGGIYRRGTFAEASRITHVDVFFEPVAAENRWRGVVKRLNGATIASSPWRVVTGRARHEFTMQTPVTVAANEEVLIGVEPEDHAWTAKAFTNEAPNDLMPGSFQVDKGTYHFKVPPTTIWTGKIVLGHGGYHGTVRRLDPETGQTILWEVGPGNANIIKSIALSPNGNNFAFGWSGNLRLADPVDGSTIWTLAVTGVPLEIIYTADSSTMYVITDSGRLYKLDLNAATPPGVVWNISAADEWFALSPNETKIYARSSANADRVREINTVDGSVGWEYQAATTISAIACSNTKVYVGASGSAIDQVDAASGVRDWRITPVASNHVYDFGYRPGDDYLYYLSGNGWIQRVLLETRLDEAYINAGSYTYEMIYDGTHFYVGHNNATNVRQYDAVSKSLVWTSPIWPTWSTSSSYQSGIAVNNVQNWDTFNQLTTNKLAVSVRREVDFNPLSGADGVLRADKYYRSYIELPVRTIDLKGLTPTIGQLRGQGRQVGVQYTVDNGVTWRDLTMDARNSFEASVLRVRLVIEPADYIENWTRKPNGNYTISTYGYMSDVSNQPYRDNSGHAGALAFSIVSDALGSAWRLNDNTRESQDGWYFAVDPGALQPVADGDLEAIFYSYGHTGYPHQLWFRGTWGAAWRLMIRNDGVWLYNPGGAQVATSGAWPAGAGGTGTDHYHFRIIWKGDRLVVFRQGVQVLNYTGLTDEDKPFLAWNEQIHSNICHLHAIRGRGMAKGNPIQTDVIAADLVELSHAAMFFDRV